LTKSQDAVKDAKEAEMLLKEKDLVAEEALNKISSVHGNVEKSSELAQMAYDMAYDAKNRSQSESERVELLTGKIDEFLEADNATPEQVKNVAEECLQAEMTMDTAEIQDLANEINKATGSVTDVDKINQETAGPLQKAEDLKAKADEAKMKAAAQLARAENVTKSLGDAEEAQHAAEEAINSALGDISSARKDLGFITSEMEEATTASDKTFEDTKLLLEKQKLLQTAYISNENHVKKAQTAAEGAKSQASKANSDLYKLNSDFKNVSESLSHKVSNIGSAKDRALSLQRRASTLSNSASQKLADLLDMEKQYEDNQKELEELSETLTQMNCQMQIHLKVIQSKSNFYTACNPPGTWEPAEDCACKTGETEPECQTRASPARY
jgi:chromosome segregation ATPase